MFRDPETTTNSGEGTRNPALERSSSNSQHRLRGLTPDLFWSFRSTLLTTPRNDLDSVIDGLVGPQTLKQGGPTELGGVSALKPVHAVHGRLLSAAISDLPRTPPSLSPAAFENLPRPLAYVLIAPRSPHEHPVEGGGDLARQDILHVSLPAAVSTYSNFLLHNIFPRVIPFIRERLTVGEDVCVACPTGKDLGPGVIVAVLSLFFTDKGVLLCGDSIRNKGH